MLYGYAVDLCGRIVPKNCSATTCLPLYSHSSLITTVVPPHYKTTAQLKYGTTTVMRDVTLKLLYLSHSFSLHTSFTTSSMAVTRRPSFSTATTSLKGFFRLERNAANT